MVAQHLLGRSEIRDAILARAKAAGGHQCSHATTEHQFAAHQALRIDVRMIRRHATSNGVAQVVSFATSIHVGTGLKTMNSRSGFEASSSSTCGLDRAVSLQSTAEIYQPSEVPRPSAIHRPISGCFQFSRLSIKAPRVLAAARSDSGLSRIESEGLETSKVKSSHNQHYEKHAFFLSSFLTIADCFTTLIKLKDVHMDDTVYVQHLQHRTNEDDGT